MHSKKKAPIVIFSYNRLWNLKKLLESLKKNYYYDQSKIYIFQDGYNKEMDKIEINKIKKTTKFLKDLSKSNKNIYLIIRNKKFGLSKNIIQGVTYVIKKYKKVIVLEDDLILSKNFLNFISFAVPCAGLSLLYGRPSVKFILFLFIILNGIKAWSWYMDINNELGIIVLKALSAE